MLVLDEQVSAIFDGCRRLKGALTSGQHSSLTPVRLVDKMQDANSIKAGEYRAGRARSHSSRSDALCSIGVGRFRVSRAPGKSALKTIGNCVHKCAHREQARAGARRARS